MSPERPTAFVIDDDRALLDSLREFAASVDLPLKTFSTAQEFLDQYDPDQRGCLVLDVRLPGANGLELQSLFAAKGIYLPVIVISGHGDIPMAVRAVQAGALDFLEKPFRNQRLYECIQRAFELDSQRRQQTQRRGECSQRYTRLTRREQDVMGLLVRGKSGKQIAADLGISYKTIEKFRAKVMQKMQARSVAQLVLMAVDLDLVTAESGRPQTVEKPAAPQPVERVPQNVWPTEARGY